MKNDYYKAYDKRYRQTYENNSLWEISERTKEVIDTLKKYKITKNSNILKLLIVLDAHMMNMFLI